MQFKYPELLWALLLLLIPIIIHLFQLRRFKRTPFTNVSLLQKVVAQTRRSQSLKRWLLLFTRMLLFAALILAFAQPFSANETALLETETVIYVDDSFSMQAQTENGDLLEISIQDLIRALPPDNEISLFTNEETYENVLPAAIKNELIGLSHTYNQYSMDEVILKARSLFRSGVGSRKQLLVISDFQERMYQLSDSLKGLDVHLIQLNTELPNNISIDSITIADSSPTQLELKALLSRSGIEENTPVSMWNADTLIAKTAAKFGDNGRAEVVFTLPQDVVVNGRIEIDDSGLNYDNKLYFNINKKPRIRVLAVGDQPADFLKRIFNRQEFYLEQYSLSGLNYSDIDRQNLIVLYGLTSIPIALDNALKAFTDKGGSLVIIPNSQADLISYNQLLGNYSSSGFTETVRQENQITSISFQHPLFKNVFEQSVTNFQYPMVNSYYKMRTVAPPILRLQNGDPFLVGNDRVFIFAASIDQQNSNFMNSPLIVPTLYNMGAMSLRLPALYHALSSDTKIDIPVSLPPDEIARVVRDDYEFIPLQQSFSNRTSLNFEEYPSEDGIFDIVLKDSLISKIGFNYPRAESELVYADLSDASVSSVGSDISDLLTGIEKDSSIKELWLWFVILALLFVLAEVLVQKLIK